MMIRSSEEILDEYHDRLLDGGVSETDADALVYASRRLMDSRQAMIVDALRLMVRQWESGQDSVNLYSLGLRHAIDIIEGRLEDLPPYVREMLTEGGEVDE